MPNVYKPRTRGLDAGAYSFEVATHADGSMSAAVIHISAAGGIRTVAYLTGAAAPAADGTLLTVVDAYEAQNRLEVKG